MTREEVDEVTTDLRRLNPRDGDAPADYLERIRRMIGIKLGRDYEWWTGAMVTRAAAH